MLVRDAFGNSFFINVFYSCYPFCNKHVVCLYSVSAVHHDGKMSLFLLSMTREKLVTAIWQVKPILKWEIDSIQAVIDEEKEHLQGKVHEITVRIFTHDKPYIRTLCVPSCFHVLDHASTSFQLKIKEAFHIQREQRSLNQQLHHANLKLSF